MLGLFLCGVVGVASILTQGFCLFLSRRVFGIGCGLIVPSVHTPVIGFFDRPLCGSLGSMIDAVCVPAYKGLPQAQRTFLDAMAQDDPAPGLCRRSIRRSKGGGRPRDATARLCARVWPEQRATWSR